MTRVFADTFYFLALLNTRDAAHPAAAAAADQISQLVTTEWVFVELADGMASSRHRYMFAQTRDELRADPNVTVLPFDPDVYRAGIALYAARSDKEWSLTDCTSFEVMRRLGLTHALTGDHHFEQAGFVALLK